VRDCLSKCQKQSKLVFGQSKFLDAVGLDETVTFAVFIEFDRVKHIYDFEVTKNRAAGDLKLFGEITYIGITILGKKCVYLKNSNDLVRNAGG
jgi:hypothetical protein